MLGQPYKFFGLPEIHAAISNCEMVDKTSVAMGDVSVWENVNVNCNDVEAAINRFDVGVFGHKW